MAGDSWGLYDKYLEVRSESLHIYVARTSLVSICICIKIPHNTVMWVAVRSTCYFSCQMSKQTAASQCGPTAL